MASAKTNYPHTPELLVDKTATVYSLPFFYERLTEIINHPRCSITDITNVITEDQGLTARLLKLANSPLFGYYSRIDSIPKAVTIIGTEQIRDLALAMSILEIFSGIPEELFSMKAFWRHSVSCGIVAREIATYRRENNVERYFATGILHDVGLLVMCSIIPDTVRKLLDKCLETGRLYPDLEQSHVGFTHAEVGRELFSRWKLPAGIIEPISCHHSPRSAVRFPHGAAIIHLADIICQALDLGTGCERYVNPLDSHAWDLLDIPANALSRIIRHVEPQLDETLAIMGEYA